MKYKVKAEEYVAEDNNILNKGNDYEIAEIMGCSPSYINLLRHGKRIAPYSFYLKLKEKLDDL